YYGKYHLVNEGKATRYDVAREIADYLQVGAEGEAVSSKEFVLRAGRPASEDARGYKLSLLGLPPMRNWKLGIRVYLAARFPAQGSISSANARSAVANGVTGPSLG